MASTRRIGAHAISVLIPDLGAFPGPRYRAVSQSIGALLLDGRLAPGLRLPSERDLAMALGISRSTATAAYDELARKGMLSRRQGSGSYLELPRTAAVAATGGRIPTHDRPGIIDLSIAAMPAPPGRLTEAIQGSLDEIEYLSGKSGYLPYGLPDLRRAIADRYTAKGLPTDTEQILICNGAQHGIDLALRVLANPGDRVLTELPTYPGALEAIRAHHGRAVAVPFAPDGAWDTVALANALSQASPRLAYLMPDFQNPTGALASQAHREAVVAAARRAGTTLAVDESWTELSHGHVEVPAPMASIDRAIITIGSLSKAIWGGLRIGWIRADRETIHRLAMARARSDMSGSVLTHVVALRLFEQLDAILDERRIQLRSRSDTLLAALATRLPAWRPTRPDGGLAVWVELDSPGSTPLTHAVEQRGVLLTPGSRFAMDGTLERFVRLPFALPEAELTTAVDRLAAAWEDLDLDRVEQPASVLVPA